LSGPGNDVIYGGDSKDECAQPRCAGDCATCPDAVDLLDGGPGDDWLFGGPGTDEIYGGEGFDVCVGGGGHDKFYGCEVIIQ
jgi:Ca2+-binding RTX toxin-like protein